MRLSTLIAAVTMAASPAAAQLALTPSQTEGPYYPRRVMPAETDNDLTRVGNGPAAQGEHLVIRGDVVEPSGKPIANAKVEIWQTDHQGIYLHPGDENMKRRDTSFQFYGVAQSDDRGRFSFRTIFPARYPGRARHIHVKVTPSGGATLTTQLYFAGDDDLARDGLARRLGKSLDALALVAKPSVEAGGMEAAVRFVVRPGSRS